MSNTRIILDRQSDLSLTSATLSNPHISNPTGLVQGDISGLTQSLDSIDSRLNLFDSGFVQSITFSGNIDGVNTTFTNTSNNLSSISYFQIFHNGLLQDNEDCSLVPGSTSSVLTFTKAPETGSKILVLAFKSPSI